MKKYVVLLLVIIIFFSVLVGLLFAQNDPVEQAKQARDEKLQLYAAEFIQATVLYYSSHAALPWFLEQEKGANCFKNHSTMMSVPLNMVEDCLKILISENALRNDYLETVQLDKLRITNPNPQTGAKLDTIVCFQPQSKVWQQDTQTRYHINGTHAPAGQCPSQGGSEFCYWCTQ